jgi:hypothetical protein
MPIVVNPDVLCHDLRSEVMAFHASQFLHGNGHLSCDCVGHLCLPCLFITQASGTLSVFFFRMATHLNDFFLIRKQGSFAFLKVEGIHRNRQINSAIFSVIPIVCVSGEASPINSYA